MKGEFELERAVYHIILSNAESESEFQPPPPLSFQTYKPPNPLKNPDVRLYCLILKHSTVNRTESNSERNYDYDFIVAFFLEGYGREGEVGERGGEGKEGKGRREACFFFFFLNLLNLFSTVRVFKLKLPKTK